MSEETLIPLFPLNSVLYPHSKLPLYIFEERYKKMINECLSNESLFGINYFADRKMFMIGCSAVVEEVVNRAPAGEMNIVTRGMQRYRIIKYDLGEEGYYKGSVEFIDEEGPADYDKAKMKEAINIYNELIEIAYKGSVKKIDLSETKWIGSKRSVIFTMAEKSGLSLPERQNLLEINSEDNRLDFILKYFAEVMPKIREADKISEIIKSDGYIQQ